MTRTASANLLSNAIRFSEPGGQVDLSIAAVDLTVSSKLGKGSTFTLWLPAAPAEGGSGAPPVADEEMVTVEVGSARTFELAGRALLSNLGAVLGKYVERLRRERAGPGAATIPELQLASQVAPLLANIATTLLTCEPGGRAPARVTAALEVQRVCGREHGRQRARLGWEEADINREYDALVEEIIQCVHDACGSALETGVVIAAIRSRFDEIRAYSLCGMRSAEARD